MPKALWETVKEKKHEPYHYWLERALDEALDPNAQVLCQKMKGAIFDKGTIINVTTLVVDTTCQDCLEWLHA